MRSLRTGAVALAMAAATGMGVGVAAAANCPTEVQESYNRSLTGSAAVHTVVEYQAGSGSAHKKSFDVTISRNGKQKKSGTATAENPQVGYVMKGSQDDIDAEVSVKIARSDGEGTGILNCAYNVKANDANAFKTAYMTWSLPDGSTAVCEDVSAICEDCTLTCSQNFHGANARWNTKLTISD